MAVLLIVLHVLFFVPIVSRVRRAELAAGTRRPAMIVHAAGLVLLWVGVAVAVAQGAVPGAVTVRGGLGALLVAAAVALNAWSVATLRSWRLLPDVDADHELCTTGPYRLVRHPVYLALDLLGAGSALWLARLPVVVAAVVLVAGGAARARIEEESLTRGFGDAYRDYARRVRRWLPIPPSGADGRMRLAELSSSVGAGVLGVGAGVLAASYLHGLGLPILLAGLVLHAWGMTDKHRLETRQGAVRVWWSTALYWICWVGLAGISVYAFWRYSA